MRKLIFISLLILISSISVVSASEDLIQENSLTSANPVLDSENVDSNIKTLNNNQKPPITSSNEKTFDDVQKSIDSAVEGSTIELDGIYNGNSKEILINKAVTIKGVNGKATLNAKGLSRIFYINVTGVVLDNLNLINGKSVNGGGIYAKQGLTITNSDLTNNIAISDGGAICSKSNELNDYATRITNCNFNSNTANEGGAVYSGSNLKVVKSKFNNNMAFSGGAICCEDDDDWNKDKLIIDSCIFTKNTALKNKKYYIPYNGGGAVVSDFKKSTITNSKFISNNAATNGGALYITRNLNCNNCTFTKNTAKEYAVSFITANIIEFEEYVGDYDVKFNKCTINSNSAKDKVKLIGSNYRRNSVDLNNVIIGKYKYTVKNYNNNYYTIKLVDKKTNKPVKGIKVTLKIGNNKKTLKTNKNGNIVFKVNSIMKKKSYNKDIPFLISFANSKSYLLLNQGFPGKLVVSVKAPKIANMYKKSRYFKINLKDKVTKKNLKNVKFKVLIYTGKKYKSYKLKTSQKGNAKVNIKNLSVGPHNVVIKSADSKYEIYAKSSINVKKFMVLSKNNK